MKKVLIFGGSGQIGRHLIRRLTNKNYLVTVVTRNLHKKGTVLRLGGNPGYIEIIEANIFNEEIYSFRRIRLAPMLVILGFIIEVYAILTKPE